MSPLTGPDSDREEMIEVTDDGPSPAHSPAHLAQTKHHLPPPSGVTGHPHLPHHHSIPSHHAHQQHLHHHHHHRHLQHGTTLPHPLSVEALSNQMSRPHTPPSPARSAGTPDSGHGREDPGSPGTDARRDSLEDSMLRSHSPDMMDDGSGIGKGEQNLV